MSDGIVPSSSSSTADAAKAPAGSPTGPTPRRVVLGGVVNTTTAVTSGVVDGDDVDVITSVDGRQGTPRRRVHDGHGHNDNDDDDDNGAWTLVQKKRTAAKKKAPALPPALQRSAATTMRSARPSSSTTTNFALMATTTPSAKRGEGGEHGRNLRPRVVVAKDVMTAGGWAQKAAAPRLNSVAPQLPPPLTGRRGGKAAAASTAAEGGAAAASHRGGGGRSTGDRRRTFLPPALTAETPPPPTAATPTTTRQMRGGGRPSTDRNDGDVVVVGDGGRAGNDRNGSINDNTNNDRNDNDNNNINSNVDVVHDVVNNTGIDTINGDSASPTGWSADRLSAFIHKTVAEAMAPMLDATLTAAAAVTPQAAAIATPPAGGTDRPPATGFSCENPANFHYAQTSYVDVCRRNGANFTANNTSRHGASRDVLGFSSYVRHLPENVSVFGRDRPGGPVGPRSEGVVEEREPAAAEANISRRPQKTVVVPLSPLFRPSTAISSRTTAAMMMEDRQQHQEPRQPGPTAQMVRLTDRQSSSAVITTSPPHRERVCDDVYDARDAWRDDVHDGISAAAAETSSHRLPDSPQLLRQREMRGRRSPTASPAWRGVGAAEVMAAAAPSASGGRAAAVVGTAAVGWEVSDALGGAGRVEAVASQAEHAYEAAASTSAAKAAYRAASPGGVAAFMRQKEARNASEAEASGAAASMRARGLRESTLLAETCLESTRDGGTCPRDTRRQTEEEEEREAAIAAERYFGGSRAAARALGDERAVDWYRREMRIAEESNVNDSTAREPRERSEIGGAGRESRMLAPVENREGFVARELRRRRENRESPGDSSDSQRSTRGSRGVSRTGAAPNNITPKTGVMEGHANTVTSSNSSIQPPASTPSPTLQNWSESDLQSFVQKALSDRIKGISEEGELLEPLPFDPHGEIDAQYARELKDRRRLCESGVRYGVANALQSSAVNKNINDMTPLEVVMTAMSNRGERTQAKGQWVIPTHIDKLAANTPDFDWWFKEMREHLDACGIRNQDEWIDHYRVHCNSDFWQAIWERIQEEKLDPALIMQHPHRLQEYVCFRFTPKTYPSAIITRIFALKNKNLEVTQAWNETSKLVFCYNEYQRRHQGELISARKHSEYFVGALKGHLFTHMNSLLDQHHHRVANPRRTHRTAVEYEDSLKARGVIEVEDEP